MADERERACDALPALRACLFRPKDEARERGEDGEVARRWMMRQDDRGARYRTFHVLCHDVDERRIEEHAASNASNASIDGIHHLGLCFACSGVHAGIASSTMHHALCCIVSMHHVLDRQQGST